MEEELKNILISGYSFAIAELVITGMLTFFIFHGSTLCKDYMGFGGTNDDGTTASECDISGGEAGRQQMTMLFLGMIAIIFAGALGYPLYKFINDQSDTITEKFQSHEAAVGVAAISTIFPFICGGLGWSLFEHCGVKNPRKKLNKDATAGAWQGAIAGFLTGLGISFAIVYSKNPEESHEAKLNKVAKIALTFVGILTPFASAAGAGLSVFTHVDGMVPDGDDAPWKADDGIAKTKSGEKPGYMWPMINFQLWVLGLLGIVAVAVSAYPLLNNAAPLGTPPDFDEAPPPPPTLALPPSESPSSEAKGLLTNNYGFRAPRRIRKKYRR